MANRPAILGNVGMSAAERASVVNLTAQDAYLQKSFGLNGNGTADNAAKLFAMLQHCESTGRPVILDGGDYLINPFNWPGCYVAGGGQFFSNMVIRGNGKVRIILDTTTSGTPGSDAPVSIPTTTGRMQTFCSVAKGKSLDVEGVEFEGWNQTFGMEEYTVTDGNTNSYVTNLFRIVRCKFYKCRSAVSTIRYETSISALDVDQIRRFIFRENECIDMWMHAVFVLAHRLDRAVFSDNYIYGVGEGCASTVPSTMNDADYWRYGVRIGGGSKEGLTIAAITNVPFNRLNVSRKIQRNTFVNIIKNTGSGHEGDCAAIQCTGAGIVITHNDISENTNLDSPQNCESIYTKGFGEIAHNDIYNGGGEAAIQLKGVRRPKYSGNPRWADASYIQASSPDYDHYASPWHVHHNRIRATDGSTRLRNGINCIILDMYDYGPDPPSLPYAQDGNGTRVPPTDDRILIEANYARGVAIGVGCQNQLDNFIARDNDIDDGVVPPDAVIALTPAASWYQRGSNSYGPFPIKGYFGSDCTLEQNRLGNKAAFTCGIWAYAKEPVRNWKMRANDFARILLPDYWVASASYTLGDRRTYLNKAYRAKTTHSGVGTAPSSDSTNWEDLGFVFGVGIVLESSSVGRVDGLVVDSNYFQNYPMHDNNHGTYQVGDIVRRRTANYGELFLCKAQHSTSTGSPIEVTDTSKWISLGLVMGLQYATYFYAGTATNWSGRIQDNIDYGCQWHLPNPDNFIKTGNRHMEKYNNTNGSEAVSSTANSAGVITFV